MAKLTTRSLTATTVTADNKPKGSALTHSELDSNFLNLETDKLENTTDDFTGTLSIKGSGGAAVGQIDFYDNDDSHKISIKSLGTVAADYTLTLPPNDGDSGQVLTTDGSGVLTWTSKTVDSTNLVDDTTPQLGGDLDVNGNDIVSTSEGNIKLAPDGNGEVDITSNIKQEGGKIIEQFGGQTGLLIHDQSEGGYTTQNYSTPAGMLTGPGIHIDSAGQFQYPALVLRNNSISGYPNIWAAKARPSGGTNYGTDAYMENNETIFRFFGAPYKDDAAAGEEYFTAGASGDFKASEDHSDGNLGCKIEFGTINNGTTTNTTKLTLDDDIQAHTAIRLDEVSAPTSVTDKGFIYAKDVSGTAEVFVMDAAGNETQISPHNAEGEWQYFSKNVKTGKTVRINMEAMIRDIEQLTGKTYIENE